MFNELADLPKSIDALIEGLIGFLYRILSTFTTVAFSPRWGAVRAHALRERFLKAAPALLVSTCLIAVSSVLGPQKIPELLAENRHEILLWITYLLLLYLTFDCAILLCAAILNRRRRYRQRTVAILRYSVAAMITIWFVVAIASQKLLAGAATVGAHSAAFVALPSLYKLFRTLIMWWAWIPLAGGVFVVSWSSSRTLWKRIVYLGITGIILSLCANAVDKHSLSILYATARAAFPEEDTQKTKLQESMPAAGHSRRELRVDPLVCQLSKSGQMRVSAAISNDSDLPITLDAAYLKLSVDKADSNLLHPDFLDVPVYPDKVRIQVFQPKSAIVLDVTVSIPRTELAKLGKSCLLGYSGDRSKDPILLSEVGSVEMVNVRAPR